MLLLGILAGLASAILQSCSYVASALFLKRHANPREMLFYSQGVQALFALPLFLLLVPAGALADSGIWLANFYWLAIFTVTQLSMFQAQEHVEPSKIATWLGLKIVVLALMTLVWPQGAETVGGWQWLAIALMLTAVTALNFSGGMNPGWKGGAWLATFVVVASLCDREQVAIINLFRAHGASLFQSALLTLALGYWTFGLIAAGFVGGRLVRGETVAGAWRKTRDSAPFAVFWFTAMMAIYFCYGQLGAVFGNVVQSTRALIAVVVAFIACRILKDSVEQPVSRAMWLRRAGAAFLMTAGIVLYSLSGRAAVPPSGWRVADLNGAPGLYRDGKPVAPVLFWQWEVEERDARAMKSADVNLFGVFGSFPHYAHPYWVPDGGVAGAGRFGGMAYQDANLDKILSWVPDAAFLPRLFYSAPDWWIAAHPDEQVRYTGANVLAPSKDGTCGAIARESFASETFRRTCGPVYRQAVRHLMDRYGDHLLGIHLTSGPWGEHFAWDALTQLGATPLEKSGFSDSSRPMTARFRCFLREQYGNDVSRLRDAWKDASVDFDTAAVPDPAARLALDSDGVWRDPARGRRVPDYLACMNAVTVEMLDHFAGIVKDESRGSLPTLAFYGYTQDERWAVECDHRAISRAYCSPNLDMFSAPHTYHRRSPGEDGLMRCYLASAALHGKLFVDEGDDMTHLEQAKPHPDFRCSATNLFESVNLLYREFGNAVTHGIGLWYMDLKRDTFRHPELVAAVGRMRAAADLALAHDRAHLSEVAVVSNVESEFYMGYRRTEANNVCELLYLQQMGAFPRAGAPFDWYLAEDLDAVLRRDYKVVVFLDCQYLSETQRRQVEALKSHGRTLVFFHAPGYVSETGLSRARMESVCGVKMKPDTVRGVLSAVDAATGREWGCGLDRVVDGLGDRPRGVRHRTPGTAQRGLFLPAAGETLMTGVGDLADIPVAVMTRHADWTGVFSALPALAPDVLRRLYGAAGVHVYTDADVVLSANRSWLMLHTRAKGDYEIRLPRRAAKVVDVACGKVVATDADRFVYPLERFQTAVLLLD